MVVQCCHISTVCLCTWLDSKTNCGFRDDFNLANNRYRSPLSNGAKYKSLSQIVKELWLKKTILMKYLKDLIHGVDLNQKFHFHKVHFDMLWEGKVTITNIEIWYHVCHNESAIITIYIILSASLVYFVRILFHIILSDSLVYFVRIMFHMILFNNLVHFKIILFYKILC